MEPLPPWGFALPDPARVPEVMVSGLALEAADAPLLAEVVAHFLPGPLPAVRPPHTRVHAAAARAPLSVSGAPTKGGFSHCIRASPIRLQASLILDRHLS